jgi:hypothetical protein
MSKKKELSQPVKLWLKALRSGKYKQTKGVLKDSIGYCCLGVASELAVQQGIIKKFRHSDTGLMPKVQKWLGLSGDYGEFNKSIIKNGDFFDSLAGLNDKGSSFKKIAQIIERQPEGLFVE